MSDLHRRSAITGVTVRESRRVGARDGLVNIALISTGYIIEQSTIFIL